MPKYEFEGAGGEGGFEPLPKGDYTIRIDSVEPGVSKGSGGEQFIVKGQVVEGPEDGKQVTIFYSRSPKSLWKWRALLDATGVDYEATDTGKQTEDGKPIEVLSFDTDDLEGAEVTYTVGHRTHEGKTYENWDNERAPEGVEREEAPPAEAPPAEPPPASPPPASPAAGRRRRTRA